MTQLRIAVIAMIMQLRKRIVTDRWGRRVCVCDHLADANGCTINRRHIYQIVPTEYAIRSWSRRWKSFRSDIDDEPQNWKQP